MNPRNGGLTLVEMMIAVAIISVLTLLAVPGMGRWREAQAVKGTARTLEGAFSLARSEAIRTGNNHLLFFLTDALLNPLLDAGGNAVPVLIVDDGRPGSANQNCDIDVGEPRQAVRLEAGVGFGVNQSSGAAPADSGSGTIATGSSFTEPGGVNQASWVLFRSDGTPLPFDSGCAMGPVGSGGGAIYVFNAQRDSAVVLTPLGGTRVHGWNAEGGTWTN